MTQAKSKFYGMSQLHMLITEAIEAGISEENTIELMVEEGLPREACADILRAFKATA